MYTKQQGDSISPKNERERERDFESKKLCGLPCVFVCVLITVVIVNNLLSIILFRFSASTFNTLLTLLLPLPLSLSLPLSLLFYYSILVDDWRPFVLKFVLNFWLFVAEKFVCFRFTCSLELHCIRNFCVFPRCFFPFFLPSRFSI